MAQLRPRAERCVQLLVGPGAGLHERRVALAAGRGQRQECIQPAPVEILRPIALRQRRELRTQPRHLLFVVGVGGFFVHRIKNLVRSLRAKDSQHIQTLREQTGLGARADFVVDKLLENVGVGDETLAHEAEGLTDGLRIFLVSDIRRHDARRGQLHRLSDEGIQPGGVSQILQRRRPPVDRRGHGLIVVDRQIVAGADKEGGRPIDAIPHFQGRLRSNRALLQRRHDQQRTARLLTSERQGLSRLARLQAEADAPVPHHGLEERLELVVARIVATWGILAVVFFVAKEGRIRVTLVRLDQRQFLLHNGAHVGRDGRRGIQQPGRHREESERGSRRILDRPLRRLVLPIAGRQHGHAQPFGGSDQVVKLDAAQDVVVQDVIGMQNAVRGNEKGHVAIFALLVDVVDLGDAGGRDHKPVTGQQRFLLIAQLTQQRRVAYLVGGKAVGSKGRPGIDAHGDVGERRQRRPLSRSGRGCACWPGCRLNRFRRLRSRHGCGGHSFQTTGSQEQAGEGQEHKNAVKWSLYHNSPPLIRRRIGSKCSLRASLLFQLAQHSRARHQQ